MTVTERLAVHGGDPVRTTPFPTYNTVGEEERRRVLEVLDSGVLSGFTGTWTPSFYGGRVVRSLEREWAEYFRMPHAVAVNSATSGLYAAAGAAGIGPGDEVIVSPYSMSASATAPLVWGAVPVFADIDSETFCLSPEAVRRAVNERTRAIIAVDLFGQPAAMDELMAIATQHNLALIEDAAQAPGARLGHRYAGTLGHIGVFSLNYHKMIQSGEGGVVVTDDPELAERVQLIRNHAEAVVEDRGTTDLVNMIGFNVRMTEIEAAIASEQLKKLQGLIERRIAAADYLTERLSGLPGLTPPVPRNGVAHAYYVYALVIDAQVLGVSRSAITDALRAEGVPIVDGYVKPLYLAPLFQRRVAMGAGGFPFTYPGYEGSASYERGICPVAERLHYSDLLYTDLCHPGMGRTDLDDVARAFEKVISNAGALVAAT